MFATRRRGGGDLGMKKGWSSELGLPPARVSRIVLPFDKGRAVPTKWEDAEKWIVSPVGSENNAVGRSLVVEPAHHRQPKSKSGPLVREAYLSSQTMGSPLSFDGGRFAGFDTSPPFLNGVLKGGGDGGAGRGRFSMEKYEPCILRSVSVRGWGDSMGETCSSSIPSSSQVSDEPTKGIREASTKLSSSVLRKDMATQMSTDESTQSSPKESHSFSQSTSSHPLEEIESQLSDLKTREGQVDDRVIVTRWSKKHVRKSSGKHSVNIFEWKKKTTEAKADMSAGLEAGTPLNCISKCIREEAKIAAWENLQKAKAEAAIRKLEMKLEKKRSSSMDKILGKLQSAQRKTQDMRRTNQQQQVENCSKRSSRFRRTGQISSLSSCFTCPAF